MDALWNSIDLIQCITLRERPERRKAAERQFADVGLAGRVEFIEQERDVEDGKRGCFLGHQLAAANALAKGAKHTLTFEDDVIFLDHFTPHLAARAAAFLKSEEEWSIFFLGHFPRKMELLDGWADIVRVRSMDGHAYVLSATGARELCGLAYSGDQVDVHFHYRCGSAYALFPMVAVQAPGESDTEHMQRADDWNDDKLRRERELYEGCVNRKALARALGQSTEALALMGVLGGPSRSIASAAPPPTASSDDMSVVPPAEAPTAPPTIMDIMDAAAPAAEPSLPPAVEALFSLVPWMRTRDYAFTLDEYTRRFDASTGPLPCFPPPTQDSLGLPRHKGTEMMPPGHATPFVSTSAGSLPRGTPNDVDELVGTYLVGGAAKAPPNIDVDFEPVCCTSNGEARRALTGAAARGASFWAAVHVPGIEHPSWWPQTARPVPGFEHMIVGSGLAGIGMHRDRYCGDGAEAGGPPRGKAAEAERLVSTYLALGRGRKHVVLLPPTADGASVAESLGGDGCDNAYGRQQSQHAKLPARPSPAMLSAVLGSGGFWFDLDADGTGEEKGGEEEDEDEESDCEDEDEDEAAMALFLPAGWWHWLVGDSPWHVAWSGSIFPGSASPSRAASARGAGGSARGASARGRANGRGRGGRK